MRDAQQEFLAFYAGVMRAEASRRQHQPAFAAWLVECAPIKRTQKPHAGPPSLTCSGA